MPFVLWRQPCLTEKNQPKYFQSVITSPPYNIGKEYESKISVDEYINWSIEWINGACNLLTNSGCLLLNLGYMSVADTGRAVPLPYLLWD